MVRHKKLTIHSVMDSYSRKRESGKLTIRKLDRATVLIEGNSTALKFLAYSLLALAEETDCGFQMGPTSAGSSVFTKKSRFGLYLHMLPCVEKKPSHRRGIVKRSYR